MKHKLKPAQPDIVRGPLFKGIFFFAVPIMLTGVLQLLYNAADLIVVGRFAEDGELSLAAIGATGSLISLIVNFFMGLSVGASVTLAIALGAGRNEAASRIVHTSVTLSLITGLLIGVVGIAFSPIFLSWMGCPENVIGLSSLYLRIYFIGAPAQMFYNFGAAILRTKGDTRRPLLILGVSGLVNVLFNLLFVIGFHMSVEGVAIATILSQYCSAVAVLFCLMREKSSVKISLRRLRVHGSELRRILICGVPAGIQSSVFSISNVLLQSAVNSFGEITMAGCAASGNLDGFVYIILNAFYHASMTYAGQNLGAGEQKRVNKTLLYSVIQVVMTWAVVGTLCALFAKPLVQLYMQGGDPRAIEDGAIRLQILALGYFLCGIMEIMTGHSRGMGASLTPMLMSIIGVCGMRIGWLYLVFPKERTIEMLFISFPVSWAATALVQFIGNRLVWRRVKRRYFREKTVS